MQLAKQIRELDFFRAVERSHRAGIDRRFNRRVDVVVSVADYAGADAHVAHVRELPSVEVPNVRAFRVRVITGPLFGKKQFGPFGKQLRAARNALARAPVELLASLFFF